jgi:CheY-like chemotaxis protein
MATILIVDDRDANRDLLYAVLGYQGHRLLQATDGAEALDLLRAQPCDLVITDILMPTMDGYELVRRLRAEAAIAGTRVIFYTAHYREERAKSLAETCGVQHVLTKPCEPELLLRTVDALLAGPASPYPAPPSREFAQEHLRLVTDKLSEKAGQLRIASRRLAVLVEIDLDLASERDPARLIERFCSSARELVGAAYAFAGAGRNSDVQPRHFSIAGMDAHTASKIDPPALQHGLLGTVLRQREPQRLACLADEAAVASLPSSHPPIRSLLCAPIISPTRAYGWVCVTNKIAADEFSEDDEELLAMLAALVGRIYENGSLYIDIRSRAERLESELSGHKRAEAEVRIRNAELEQHARERAVQLEDVNRGIESFSHAVCDGVRAPLRNIDNFTDALLGVYAAKLDEQGKDYLHQIRDANQQVKTLLADLLSSARRGH